MDEVKRKSLVSTISGRGYSEAGPRVLVTRQEFFEGNDDVGSIGCNLLPHPGVDTFGNVFSQIESLPGVDAVYFAITELIDEEGMWPFTDTACIVTDLPSSAFSSLLEPLMPSEIEASKERFVNPPQLPARYRLVQAWWD